MKHGLVFKTDANRVVLACGENLYKIDRLAFDLFKAMVLVKSNSSTWIKEQQKNSAWQEGYGAFSVSSSKIAAVIKYIGNQEAHHRKISFEDEFISMLKKHRIPFDPKYVFG